MPAYCPIRERLMRSIEITSGGCWEWKLRKDKQGYGRMQIGRRPKLAHRVSYEELRGKIPDGYCIDHLCKNPSCINPDHMEPVLPAENTARGNSFSAQNARKTHCPAGHELAGENLYITNIGGRACKQCVRNASRRYIRRKAKERS